MAELGEGEKFADARAHTPREWLKATESWEKQRSLFNAQVPRENLTGERNFAVLPYFARYLIKSFFFYSACFLFSERVRDEIFRFADYDIGQMNIARSFSKHGILARYRR